VNIEEVLEFMDDELDKAVQMPLTGGKSLVNVDNLRNLVDEIRLSLPGEIKQAQKLVSDRKMIINDASGEANAIIKKAEERAGVIVSQQEITRLAQQKAQEIMNDAQNRSKDLRHIANDHVDKMFGETEELLTRQLTEIKRAKNALRAKK
jgi:vacuolar-type H+-ATPase subunit H